MSWNIQLKDSVDSSICLFFGRLHLFSSRRWSSVPVSSEDLKADKELAKWFLNFNNKSFPRTNLLLCKYELRFYQFGCTNDKWNPQCGIRLGFPSGRTNLRSLAKFNFSSIKRKLNSYTKSSWRKFSSCVVYVRFLTVSRGLTDKFNPTKLFRFSSNFKYKKIILRKSKSKKIISCRHRFESWRQFILMLLPFCSNLFI